MDDFEWMRNLPGFWTTVVSQLDVIGVSAAVGSLILLAVWLRGVLDAAKKSAHIAGRGYDVFSEVIKNPPSTPFLAGLITLLVLVAQAATVGLCYIAGNYLELAFSAENKLVRLLELLEAGLWETITDGSLWNFFRWDAYSTTYVVLGCMLLLYTHSRAWNDKRRYEANTYGFLLALPASLACVILGFLGIFALVIVGALFIIYFLFVNNLLGQLWDSTVVALLPTAAFGLVCLAFWGACYAAVSGSLVVAKAWKPPNSLPQT